MKVIKRDCSEVDFDRTKISTAILKAMKNGSGIVKPKIAEDIANEIEEECKDKDEVSISDIESMVYNKLITKKQRLTAKAYEGYRSIREFQRENENTTDIEIHDLVEDKDEYWKDENANKNPVLNPTKRDYIAGSVSTDMTKRYLLSPEIIQAHNEGLIHFHDADYFLQHMHNCFHGKTRFITSEGIKSFDEFSDGSSVRVLDKDGVWRNATVRTYGKNKMYEVTFTTAKMKKTVVCTSSHRWLLQNGEVTTNLKIGDRLLPITDITDKYTIESYHESNMFTLGFLIGDGCDHIGSNLHQVRLCGHKVEYSKYFESAGYKLTAINGTDDIIATKHGYIKQDFLNSKSWKYMSENDKRLLFLGLYAADGKINGNRLCTTDERVAELIEDISCFAGFYISSKNTEIRDTQYKENSEILVYHFITHQPNNLCWKVADIKPYHSTTEYLSWCIEEPITHSFTLEGGMITGNCGLVNSEDMLQNNTVISETLIETPHSFSTACNIETQAIAQIASNQYGGQSISLAHLAPFVDVSRKSIRKKVTEELYYNGLISEYNEDLVEVVNITNKRLKEEIEKGVQTIQYQLVTLMTTNGQAPFITIFMYLNEAKNECEKADLAMLIEEMLHQRIQGVKNEEGVYIAPAFPKLIYVLEEDNITEDSKYWYLTELAAKCTSKRLVPDYISEKMMLELKGDVYTCMGCVDGKEIITYKIKNNLYVESFERMWRRLSDSFEIKHQYSEDNPNLYMDLSEVTIYDTEKGFVDTKRIIRNVSSEWLDVDFSNGRRLLCTTDHPLTLRDGRNVHASELKLGDKILINSNQYNEESILFNADKAWLLGFMLCDGCYQNNHVFASIAATGEDEIEEKFSNTFTKYFGLNVKTILQERGKKGTYKDLCAISDNNGGIQYVINYFTSKFGGINKVNRQIPNEVFSWNYEAKLAFFAGMIDADGYINSHQNENNFSTVQIGSTNKELALQQMALAQSIGIPAKIYHNHYTKKNPELIRYRVEFYPTDELVNYIVCKKKCDNYIESNVSGYAIESEVIKINPIHKKMYSYDVTTSSKHFEVSGIYSHNCRSFLTVDRFTDKVGNIANAKNFDPNKHKYYGRFNQGVVTISLPDIAFSSDGDFDKFWEIFEERTELCHKALRARHERLLGTSSDVAPILWQHGAYARLKKHEKIDRLLYDGYSTISLGYAGLYECVKFMTGHSHSDEGVGEEFGLKVMQALNDKCNQWKETENIDYSLYGTPLESTTYKFAKCLKSRFGSDIFEKLDGFDRNYITNSYHIPVFEHITAFEKLRIESKFQKLSPGGAISYIEVPSMSHNIPAILEVIKFIYNNIMYAEINTKSCYCEKCGFDGDIPLVSDENNRLKWECPSCGNTDNTTMDIAFRVCGYIGTAKNGGNQGRYGDIHDRVYHLDDMEYTED